jgi:putative membrane protein
MSTLFAFLHHVCAFALVSAVAVELALIRQELTLASARKLQAAKFSIFVAVGLLSIIPTLEFLSWRKLLSAGQVPVISAKKRRLVTAVIHGELLSIVLILLFAAIMARGGWV